MQKTIDLTFRNFTFYIDKSIETFSNIISKIYFCEDKKYDSKLNPVSKIIFVISGIIVTSFSKTIYQHLMIFLFVYSIIFFSKINIKKYFRMIFIPVFLFGFMLSFWAVFNFITPGNIVIEILKLKEKTSFLFINFPQIIGITDNGVEVFLVIFLRVLNSVSLSFYVINTTKINDIFMGMRFLKISDFLIMIFMLTIKYIDIFSKTIMDMYMARKSRVIKIDLNEEKNWIFQTIVYILKKSIIKQQAIFDSMISRGFRCDIKFAKLQRFNRIDFMFISMFVIIFCFIICLSI